MKHLSLLLLLLLSGMFGRLVAQQDSTIYGLARNSSPPEVFLAAIDAQTGLVSNISGSSLGIGLTLTSTTIDPHAGIFYFSLEGNLIGVDLATGSVVSSPTLTFSNGTYFDGFLFNCSDSLLYGLARNNSPNEVFLATVDPVNGVVTNISPQSIATSITFLGTTIDPIQRIFYFISNNELVGVDMDSGTLVSSPVITNTNGAYLNGILYNPADSSLYGLAQNSSPATIYFAKVNPQTGVVNNISPTSISTSITLSSYTLNAGTHHYHFISDGQFHSVDIATGMLTASPVINNTNGTYFDGFRYYQAACAGAAPAYAFDSDSLWICAGDSAFLGGAYQSMPGSYVDTLLNTGGSPVILTTYLSVRDTALNAIAGTIFFQGQAITSGLVGLIHTDPINPSILTIVDSLPVNADGTYLFDGLANGTYRVIALGDQNLYPSMPTYAPGTDLWQLADSVVLAGNCPDTLAAFDIQLVELATASIGTGTIVGQVSQRVAQAAGAPAGGVWVTLRQADDQAVVQMTRSDAGGDFRLENIPFGTYRIYVDRAGYQMDSSHVFVFNDTTASYNAAVCINTDLQTIEVCDQQVTTGIPTPLQVGMGLTIAPNPFQEGFHLTFDQQQPVVQYTLRDAMGRALLHRQLTQTQEVSLDLRAHPAGIYLLLVQYGQQQVMERMVKQ